MKLEVNPIFAEVPPTFVFSNSVEISVTPPIDDGYWYWWLRVPLTDTQAVIAFPKFLTIGVGLQIEDDWNTNLPYTCSPNKIASHIFHNAGDPTISLEGVVEAIEVIQEAIARLWPNHDPANVVRMRVYEKEIKESGLE